MSEINLTEKVIVLIERMTALESKIDRFLEKQSSHEKDLATLRSEVEVISDTLASYKTYFKILMGLFTAGWSMVTIFVLPYIQKKFGL